MTRIRRQRPWALGLTVFLVTTVAFQAQGRLLFEGAASLSGGTDQYNDVSGEGTEAAGSTGSASFHNTDVTSTSLSDWFQLHLMMMEAFQRALVQSLMQQLTTDGDIMPDSSGGTSATQEQLLRNVGCARMHAALLNRPAKNGELPEGSEISVYGDEEEYYDDYSGGSVASRVAYTAQERLRGSGLTSAADSSSAYGAASRDASTMHVDPDNLGLELSDADRLDLSSAWYANFDDDFNERYEYEDVYVGYDDMDLDDDSTPDGQEYDTYDYDGYTDYEADSIANAIVSNIDAAAESEWEDYLEQAYEYFMVYVDDAAYGAYSSDVYSDQDVPDAVSMLADIAELVAWAHMGSYSFMATTDDGSLVVVRSGNISNDGNAAAVFGPTDAALFGFTSPEEPIIVNNMNMRWINPDGSLNWGLIMLCILAAGTVAMMVGFVASWMSLWRSMNYQCVYGPCRAGKRAGKGYDGLDDDLAKPLVVGQEEVLSAVPVVHAAQYVPPVQVNDSVAKALCK